jgi:uncharacterized protein
MVRRDAVLRKLCAALAALVIFPGCGAGEAVRPNAIRGAAALGESGGTCPTPHSTPLVVDWKADERADLELAMQHGVAVVAYTCAGIKLLPDCHVTGGYGYAGVTQQEEDVQIENADELRATLPKMGALMGAQLSADLDRGTSIDIATMLVGKERTTIERAMRSDLVGTCTEATHFIRGASLGAFAMKQGTRGKIQASVTIFGSSEDATSESTKSMTSKAGVLDACKQADRGDTAPPKQCGAPFRVELDAIEAPQATAETGQRDEGDNGYVCPKGLVSSGGKCARPGTVKSFSCRLGDVDACTTQCANGNGPSCVTLGTIYHEGRGVPVDNSRGDALWKQGCELGAGNGCVGTAVKMFRGDGVPKDPDKAVAILQRECDAGNFNGCAQLALVDAFQLPQPMAQALPLGLRSCNGGDPQGCLAVGRMYKQGKGAPADPSRAKEYMERACQEGKGIGIACGQLGGLYSEGEGVAKDDATAFRYFELGCRMPLSIDVCEAAANFSEQGRGTPKDMKRAIGFLTRGCDEADKRSCARLGHIFTRTNPPNTERARTFYKKACDLGDADSCKAMQTLP